MLEKTVGLVLSGGGIKSYVQIGVLKRLKEANIRIDGYAGTSMGSIIATFAALGQSPQQIEERLLRLEKEIVDRNLLNPSTTQVLPLLRREATGLIQPKQFIEIIQKELDDIGITHIKDVKVPLVIISVDLISGSLVIFTNRKKAFKKRPFEKVIDDFALVDALQASCAFPMVFDTMDYKGMQLVDGGVLMNLPVQPMRQIGFEKIFSISMENMTEYKETKKVSDIAKRIFDVTNSDMIRTSIALSDYNLNIYHKGIGIFSFKKGKEAIDLGYKKADEAFQEIEAFKLNLKRFRL